MSIVDQILVDGVLVGKVRGSMGHTFLYHKDGHWYSWTCNRVTRRETLRLVSRSACEDNNLDYSDTAKITHVIRSCIDTCDTHLGTWPALGRLHGRRRSDGPAVIGCDRPWVFLFFWLGSIGTLCVFWLAVFLLIGVM